MNKSDDKTLEELLAKALDQQPDINLSAEFVQQVLIKATAGQQIKAKAKLYSWVVVYAVILISLTALVLKEVLGTMIHEVQDLLLAQKFNITFAVLAFLGIQLMDWRIKSRRQEKATTGMYHLP